MDAVALPAPLRLRRIELLEPQHRVQPPRIVDVPDPWSPVMGVPECGDPERADCSDVGGVEEELGEARQPRIRSGSELSSSGLELAGEAGEVEREAVGLVFPQVLPTVDDHEPGAQVDHEREAGVVGQGCCRGGQVALLRGRDGAVARHRAEHRLPVGCPGALPERVARHQVDLVAVGIGVPDPERSGGLTGTRLLDRRGRPHHVEVDAVPQRPRLRRLPDPDRRVAPQRIRQTAALPRHVVEHPLPELPQPRRVRGLEHDAHLLQHSSVRGQPEIPRGRRHRLGVFVRIEAYPRAGRAQVDSDLGRQLRDAPGQRRPLDQ